MASHKARDIQVVTQSLGLRVSRKFSRLPMTQAISRCAVLARVYGGMLPNNRTVVVYDPGSARLPLRRIVTVPAPIRGQLSRKVSLACRGRS